SLSSVAQRLILMADFRIARPHDKVDFSYKVLAALEGAVDFCRDQATYESSAAGVTKGQRAILTCSWYDYEVCNGGHHQFFWNSTGIVWEDALSGFRAMGALEHAQVLEAAVACFPGRRPSKDRQDRYTQLAAIAESDLDSLDRQLYRLQDTHD